MGPGWGLIGAGEVMSPESSSIPRISDLTLALLEALSFAWLSLDGLDEMAVIKVSARTAAGIRYMEEPRRKAGLALAWIMAILVMLSLQRVFGCNYLILFGHISCQSEE